MTQQEALQKATEYCTEKAYSETLTDEFKQKFSDFFARKYPEAAADDEAAIADLKFNLDTAFSATSKGVTSKQKAFDDKEKEYKRQIEELQKKLGQLPTPPVTPPTIELPEDVKKQLEEFNKFKAEQTKQTKFKNIIALAKAGIRGDLHEAFERFAQETDVKIDETDEAQAKKLTDRFQEIFRSTIGDIKPLAPSVETKLDDEAIKNVKRVEL